MQAPSRAAAPTRAAAPRRRALLLSLVAVAATVVALGATSLLNPPGALAMGPLPACRYGDVLTSPRTYGAWATTLVDTILRVPRSYVPPNLVSVHEAGIPGRGQVRSVVIPDLRAMGIAAAAAGAAIGSQSAYRSYDEQKVVFDRWARDLGYGRALQVSARPGHSEHQLGLTIDVRSEPGGSPFDGDWATTPAGKWMKAHAWEFGFVMSYPKGKMAVTCYDYEPWHYRYVGRDVAAKIHASGLTPRQYLWAKYTTTIVPPPTTRPPASATPARTATTQPTSGQPTPSATPIASPAPSATPTIAPATVAPTPSRVATVAPTQGPPDDAPSAATGPLALGGIGLAIGTIVLGGAWLARRRGRFGAGL